MAEGAPATFFSYCRDDSEFALRLAEDLKAAGANVWLDQLDIEPGMPWDRAVENAVTNCPRMLVLLSPTSVNSDNVRDEISFALSKQKRVIPVLYRECDVPFRLARLQHIDFRADYARGLNALLRTLDVEQQAVAADGVAVSVLPKVSQPDVSEVDERKRAAERARLEEKRKQAAEQARVEPEHRRAVEERLQDEHRKSAEQAESTKQEREQAERVTEKRLFTKGWIGPFSASKFNPLRIASRTIRRSIGAVTMILIVAIGAWLLFRSSAPRKPERWNARTSGTQNWLLSIFGTSDGKRLWAVGHGGTILESNDGEHWNARTSGTQHVLNSIFGTSDGKRLWAVGEGGTILESDDGEHWNARTSGTQHVLNSIFGTSDGKRLWAVGEGGTILESDDGEHWNARTSGTEQGLYSIFGTSDGKRLWAVGHGGTILESNDGEHWNARTSGTQHLLLSIFGTSDGKRLWAVGSEGKILESDDGEHWNARNADYVHLPPGSVTSVGWGIGSEHWLHSIFGTSDGKRLWAVGEEILESDDGEHWNERTKGTMYTLFSIFGTSDGKRLWAVGENGTILEASAP